MLTYRSALRRTEQVLMQHAIAEARHEARLLVCHVVGCSLATLYAHPEHLLTRVQEELLSELLERRVGQRFPLQYLLGTVEFYSLSLRVTPHVLIPRPETEQLVALIVELLREVAIIPARVLDIGTGSGCIAIALGRAFPSSRVTGWDVSSDAVALARENAESNGVRNVEFICGNILEQLPSERFDLIVSNPPYLSQTEYTQLEPELYHEPPNALTDGSDGLRFFRRYAEIFPSLLTDGGIFALECSDGQSRSVAALFGTRSVAICRDDYNVERFVVGCNGQLASVLPTFRLRKAAFVP